MALSSLPSERNEWRGKISPIQSVTQRTSLVEGALWMVGISLALFFLPAINGLIGGFVGGYKVGSVGRALAAAVLPAVFVAVGLWILLALLGLPFVGLFTGMAIAGLVVLADVGLFLGAAIGGAVRALER